MNQAWLIFCMGLAAFLFVGGWECRGWKDGVEAAHLAEAEQANTISAQNAVIARGKKSERITTEVDNAYENQLKNLEFAYAFAGMPGGGSAQHDLPVVSGAARRPDAAACTGKLTAAGQAVVVKIAEANDQCSVKLAALQRWVREQEK